MKTDIQMLPVAKLHRSPLNVRKTGGTSIGELAASIVAAGGLIHNLVVVPEKSGRKDGFGVVAGGRRLAALQSLVKAKAITADFAVPCKVIKAGDATEFSLSENVHCEAMHPADQFEAFAKLVDEGKSAEDIAARFGVAVETVRRRLLLSRVSPVAMALYREGKAKLDHIMALTLTDDHTAQEALLNGRYLPEPYEIRRRLTETSVPCSDHRVRFVSLKAYEAAGGAVRRDLFDDKNSYLENPPLLDLLVAEKLERAAVRLREEFNWVEVVPGRLDYSERSKYGNVPTIRTEPDAKTAKKLAKLQAEFTEAQKALQGIEDSPGYEDVDDAWNEADGRCDALQDQINEIEDGLQVPNPDAAALVGAIVCIGHDGKIEKHTDLIRPQDRAKLRQAKTGDADDGVENGDSKTDTSGDPQSVRTDLSTYLTAITQEALADNVPLALRSLAYHLAAGWLCGRGSEHGVSVRMEDHGDLPVSETLNDSAIERLRRERQARWESTLPDDPEALWAWCRAADDHSIASLLAYCTARSIAGTQFSAGEQPMSPLIGSLGINVVDYWQPNAGYFKRIKKSVTLEALTAHGHTEPTLAKAKRDALAERAEQLLVNSGWLPPTLQVSGVA